MNQPAKEPTHIQIAESIKKVSGTVDSLHEDLKAAIQKGHRDNMLSLAACIQIIEENKQSIEAFQRKRSNTK